MNNSTFMMLQKMLMFTLKCFLINVTGMVYGNLVFGKHWSRSYWPKLPF